MTAEDKHIWEQNRFQTLYNVAMMIIILVSLVPLGFKKQTCELLLLDRVTVSIFIVDYMVRWILFVKRYKSIRSFLCYPITLFAIIDMLSILPSLCVLSNSFKLFRLLRFFRAFKMFRAFRLLRYSQNFIIVINVIKKEKQALVAVGTMAVAYILISSLAIFNVEPDTFHSFFDAVYWATVSLTTVGYGDIYPVSTSGKLIAMISSFIGIAIVALPAGILTAGYMSEMKKE